MFQFRRLVGTHQPSLKLRLQLIGHRSVSTPLTIAGIARRTPSKQKIPCYRLVHDKRTPARKMEARSSQARPAPPLEDGRIAAGAPCWPHFMPAPLRRLVGSHQSRAAMAARRPAGCWKWPVTGLLERGRISDVGATTIPLLPTLLDQGLDHHRLVMGAWTETQQRLKPVRRTGLPSSQLDLVAWHC